MQHWRRGGDDIANNNTEEDYDDTMETEDDEAKEKEEKDALSMLAQYSDGDGNYPNKLANYTMRYLCFQRRSIVVFCYDSTKCIKYT